MAGLTATDEPGRDNVGRYVGLRQGKYWERTESSDYYCGGCGWKVTDHDSYCPECGGALHKAALDSSNCTNSERTSDELLPCPFCGGEAEIVHTPKVIPYEPWWIRCSLCEVTTPKYKSETAKADAIAAWNRRAEHD